MSPDLVQNPVFGSGDGSVQSVDPGLFLLRTDGEEDQVWDLQHNKHMFTCPVFHCMFTVILKLNGSMYQAEVSSATTLVSNNSLTCGFVSSCELKISRFVLSSWSFINSTNIKSSFLLTCY